MVSACSAHKQGWSSLVMIAWACKGGKGRWLPLSGRGFESSVMIGVTAGAWLALAPPISPGGLLLLCFFRPVAHEFCIISSTGYISSL